MIYRWKRRVRGWKIVTMNKTFETELLIYSNFQLTQFLEYYIKNRYMLENLDLPLI